MGIASLVCNAVFLFVLLTATTDAKAEAQKHKARHFGVPTEALHIESSATDLGMSALAVALLLVAFGQLTHRTWWRRASWHWGVAALANLMIGMGVSLAEGDRFLDQKSVWIGWAALLVYPVVMILVGTLSGAPSAKRSTS